MKMLNYVFFYGWSGALLLLGGLGIFTGSWDLGTVFRIDLESMSQEAVANLLNQYRFLKAIEFGFGLFCFLFRREIFTIPTFNRLFISVVFLGAAARALSIVMEGWPHWGFIGITILEFMTFIIVTIYSRYTLEGNQARKSL